MNPFDNPLFIITLGMVIGTGILLTLKIKFVNRQTNREVKS